MIVFIRILQKMKGEISMAMTKLRIDFRKGLYRDIADGEIQLTEEEKAAVDAKIDKWKRKTGFYNNPDDPEMWKKLKKIMTYMKKCEVDVVEERIAKTFPLDLSKDYEDFGAERFPNRKK